jgi:DNA-binding transcriptional MerR regulator
MRIGELSQRTKVSTRLLRYYEEQGLLTPERSTNGYRDYSACHEDDVWQIRGLLDAGLPVRIIQQILPCLDEPCSLQVAQVSPEMLAGLERERDRMETRLEALAQSRDAITAYLEVARSHAAS